jgi:heat shock protein HslJ
MRPGPSAPASLAGTSWRAFSVAGAAPVAGREPTIAFTEDRISGTTGCNQYFGGYTFNDGAIAFSPIGMTMMACDDAVGDVESAFTKALGGASEAAIDSQGRLILNGPDGSISFDPVSTAGS